MFKTVETVTRDTAAQGDPSLRMPKTSPLRTDGAEKGETPKFYLPSDDLAIELTRHVKVMGSVLETDILYRKEDLDEHYLVLSRGINIQDPFDHIVHSPGTSNLRLGGGVSLDKGVSLATNILHST